MKYRVRIFCPDCTGDDYQGCFDGGTELLCGPGIDDGPIEFDTKEEAESAGADECAKSIWKFEIEVIQKEAGA